MTYQDQIKALTKQLYPTGRAFRAAEGGFLDKMHDGLVVGEQLLMRDALSIQDMLVPDNANFTTADADYWERVLGMIDGSASPLVDRMAAIKRKMQHPGNIPARQHYLFLERELQLAGFNVFVYENRFPSGGGYVTQTPQALAGIGGVAALQHNQALHGQRQHGGTWGNKVANYLDENLDRNFNLGSNLRSTFFIGGSPIGSYATVPLVRKQEFRQLILKIKPVQTVGLLFITYV